MHPNNCTEDCERCKEVVPRKCQCGRRPVLKGTADGYAYCCPAWKTCGAQGYTVPARVLEDETRDSAGREWNAMWENSW